MLVIVHLPMPQGLPSQMGAPDAYGPGRNLTQLLLRRVK